MRAQVVVRLVGMVRRRYPLAALRGLREERVRSTALGLAEQLEERRRAEATLRDRSLVQAQVERETRAALGAEQERWAAQSVSGAELLLAVEFETAQAARTDQLRARVEEAAGALSSEREKEAECVAQLAWAEAESRLVAEHERNHHAREAERLERSEEEAALEQWSARKR